MSFSVFSNSDKTQYGIKNYILDTVEDLKFLPTNIASGSMAFIIQNSEYYILTNKNQWIKNNQ